MIVGIGTDLVAVEKVAARVERAPQLLPRNLTDSERYYAGESVSSLAACFAAKEAVLKALGGALANAQQPTPRGWQLREIELQHHASGAPQIALHGRAAEIAQELGIARWHVSISHDGGLALAFVTAEG